MAVPDLPEPPLAALDWPRQVRLVPSCFPPIDLFERVLDPEDLELAWEIEAMTNDRLRQEAGELHRVPPQDRISAPGASPVMAAFTHCGRATRFSTGEYGVYYAAKTLDTAIAETRHHRGRFLAATAEPSCEITLRAYFGRVFEPLHDLRGPAWARLHHPADYRPSQAFAAGLRARASWGLVYLSVRDPGGECIAVLRPPAVSRPHQGLHLRYVWDGRRQAITGVFRVGPLYTDQRHR